MNRFNAPVPAVDRQHPLRRGLLGRATRDPQRDLMRQLIENGLAQVDVYRMIRRRAEDAEIHTKIGCHTFRAMGPA